MVERATERFGEKVLACPRCGSVDLDFFANFVECMDCDYQGHDHSIMPGGGQYPEFACDWREAIADWNNDPLRTILSQPNDEGEGK